MKSKTIITHNGSFHADDVFAVATLFLVEKMPTVLRTRDRELIEHGHYVVDVGGKYNPSKNQFDHHQEGGAGERKNHIPYASFGLVWKKFGEILCKNKKIANKIDKVLVQPIDANDNGVDIVTQKETGLYPYDMRAMIDSFRPTWKENATFDEYFIKAVSYAKLIIERLIIETSDREDGVRLVIEAYNKSKDKRLIEVGERWPWEMVLNDLLEPLFVIYEIKADQTWGLKTIRDDILSYSTARKKLPESWAGKRDKKLEKITGIKGSMFCHNERFLAVAKTKSAILQLAQIALNS